MRQLGLTQGPLREAPELSRRVHIVEVGVGKEPSERGILRALGIGVEADQAHERVLILRALGRDEFHELLEERQEQPLLHHINPQDDSAGRCAAKAVDAHLSSLASVAHRP